MTILQIIATAVCYLAGGVGIYYGLTWIEKKAGEKTAIMTAVVVASLAWASYVVVHSSPSEQEQYLPAKKEKLDE